MQRHSYPLITPPQGDLCSCHWVMEHPQIQAQQRKPSTSDPTQTFLTTFATSALLGGLGEWLETNELLSGDLGALGAISGAQLAEVLTIANGWNPREHFATSSANLFTPENKVTRRGRAVGPFARALEQTLQQLGQHDARVYCEVMFHGTNAYQRWLERGADPAYASGFDVIVVAGTAQRVVAIEIDEPCDLHNTRTYHATAEKKASDDRKDTDLARLGIAVVRLSERQIWRQTNASLGLVLKVLATYANLSLPTEAFRRLDYRQLQKQARFTKQNMHDQRVPHGWTPRIAAA